MKIARVQRAGVGAAGALALVTNDAPSGFRVLAVNERRSDITAEALVTTADPDEPWQESASTYRLLAPLAYPCTMMEMEANSPQQCTERGHGVPSYPMLTLLPDNVINHPGGEVVTPSWSNRVSVTAQIAFVCARTVARPEDARPDAILGYTLLLAFADWTLVDRLSCPTERDRSMNEDYGRWFDGYKPIGPWLVTPDEMPEFSEVAIELAVGDRCVVTRGADMIFGPLEILHRVSAAFPFSAGDLVALGAMGTSVEVPIDALDTGLEVRARCDEIGELTCTLKRLGGLTQSGHPAGDPLRAGHRRGPGGANLTGPSHIATD